MKKVIYLLVGFFLIACSDSADQSEVIIARVGNKSISKNEFIRRAEYTIRPAYCRSENYIHRKIVLNSLIAEKLMALEAGEDNELTANEDLNLYLQGRKEQSMRQVLYDQEMFSKVAADTNEIKHLFPLAGREYEIEYLSFSEPQLVPLINRELEAGNTGVKDLYYKLGGLGDVPNRKIGYNDPEPDPVHDVLFSDSLKKGQLLGPVRVDKDTYLLMQVKGWTRKVAITDNQVRERYEMVQTKLKQEAADVLLDGYVKNIMAGKRMEFNRATFEKMANILGPQYYKSEEEKKSAFNKKFWNKDNPEMVIDDLENQMDEILDQPLFSLDDQVWTVRMLQQEIKKHPLVFRKHKMPKNEFGEQMKLAIADLIRDQFITEDAYRKGYDKDPMVQRNYNMWRDYLLSLYNQENYLKDFDLTGKNQMNIISDILNPYVNDLYKKYGNEIEINTDEFEKIQLTAIDLYVIQKNVPYPIVVPSFPQITTHDKLDYGKKMVGM